MSEQPAMYAVDPAPAWQPRPSGARLMLRIDLGQNDVEIVAPDGGVYELIVDTAGHPVLVKIAQKETE
jgi:hypothetical protein